MLIIKKLFFLVFVGYVVVAGAQAWTTSKVNAFKDTAGEWRLHSVPQEFLNNDTFTGMSYSGMLSSITVVRDNGLWEKPIIAGRTAGNEKSLKEAHLRIEILKRSFDSILSPKELVVMTYWVELGEIIVYFHTDRWKDGDFHIKVARELNTSMYKPG